MLDERLKIFLGAGVLGIVEEADCSIQEDVTTCIPFVDGRYEVQLPWKKNHPMLPDNYQLSLKRLCRLGRRLKLDLAILHEYDVMIKSQMEQEIEEPVKPRKMTLGRCTNSHMMLLSRVTWK